MLCAMLINCDMGEGLDNDASLMPYLDLANIACAAHAGDEATMRNCVALALQEGVQIGAHVGFADRAHFGRRDMSLSASALYALCTEQILKLEQICTEFDARVQHLKPHGAMYNMMMRDDAVLRVIMRACADASSDMRLLIMAVPDQQKYQAMAAEHNICLVHEAFVDRTYAVDGLLSSRQEPGACHEDIASVMRQAESLLYKKSVRTVTGSELALRAETLCIHGDSPLALETAQQLRTLLS